jgi:hypothetical protein
MAQTPATNLDSIEWDGPAEKWVAPFTPERSEWHLEASDECDNTAIYAHHVRMDCFKWILDTGVERIDDPADALALACLAAGGRS